MPDDRMYSQDEVDRIINQATLMGSITQTLSVVTDEMKESRKNWTKFEQNINSKMDGFEQKFDTAMRDVVTRSELKEELDKYPTKESIEPMQTAFKAGSRSLGRIFVVGIILVVGLAVLVLILLAKQGVNVPFI